MNLLNKIKFAPINVQLVVTRRCNLACGYCNEYDHVSKPVPVEELKRYFEKLKTLGTMSITFSGGEPLMHPEIINVVKEAKRRIPVVSLITNAYLLTEKLINGLNQAGLNSVQISVDGVNPDKVTVKVLKFIRPKLELLHKYAKFSVNVNSVIGSTNPEEAIEVINFAKSLGFSTTIGLLHDGNGRIKLSLEQMKVYKELEASRKKPWWDRADFEKDIIEKGQSPFKCRSGSRYLYVDEFGKVRYCSQMLKMYEKNLMDFGEKDLKENFYRYKPCNKSCTIGCVRRVSWVDGWREQNTK